MSNLNAPVSEDDHLWDTAGAFGLGRIAGSLPEVVMRGSILIRDGHVHRKAPQAYRCPTCGTELTRAATTLTFVYAPTASAEQEIPGYACECGEVWPDPKAVKDAHRAAFRPNSMYYGGLQEPIPAQLPGTGSLEIASSSSVAASSGGIAIGGEVVNSTINVGDGAHVQHGVNLEDFFALLAELRQRLREAPLEAEVVEDLEAEIVSVESPAKREKPNKALVLGKVKTITDVLASAARAGEKLMPLAQRLDEMAVILF